MNIHTYLIECQERVKAALLKKLPSPHKQPASLNRAMRYAVLNGGKRLRSALIYATGESLGAKPQDLDNISAAIEMLHAYSLVHDDLPSLDNDDLRRGKPTCHKVFGESTALLAGDALQSLAFEILSDPNSLKSIKSENRIKMIHLFSQAIGYMGMIGGEELDLKMVNRQVPVKSLETMYQLKTGRLLCASILLGALAANCQDEKILDNLNQFGKRVGLAFQIHDDIIGIESDTKTLGKKQGADLELNKPVYPVLVGMERAKRREKLLYNQALAFLEKACINTDHLRAIAEYVIERRF